VTYTILALDRFHRVFGHLEHRRKMELAFAWFLGHNHLHQVIYNRTSGGCHDGLEQYHVNLNQGAESTVCYLLARLVMERTLGQPTVHKPASQQRKSRSRVRPVMQAPIGN
jgi:hypothetical protein